MDYGMTFYIAFALVVVGRMIGSSALKKLSQPEQTQVQELFLNIRVHTYVPILVIVGVVFFAASYFRTNPMYSAIAIVGYLGYLGWTYFQVLKGFKKAKVPEIYRNRFMVSFYVSQSGVLVLFAGYLFGVS